MLSDSFSFPTRLAVIRENVVHEKSGTRPEHFQLGRLGAIHYRQLFTQMFCGAKKIWFFTAQHLFEFREFCMINIRSTRINRHMCRTSAWGALVLEIFVHFKT